MVENVLWRPELDVLQGVLLQGFVKELFHQLRFVPGSSKNLLFLELVDTLDFLSLSVLDQSFVVGVLEKLSLVSLLVHVVRIRPHDQWSRCWLELVDTLDQPRLPVVFTNRTCRHKHCGPYESEPVPSAHLIQLCCCSPPYNTVLSQSFINHQVPELEQAVPFVIVRRVALDDFNLFGGKRSRNGAFLVVVKQLICCKWTLIKQELLYAHSIWLSRSYTFIHTFPFCR